MISVRKCHISDMSVTDMSVIFVLRVGI